MGIVRRVASVGESIEVHTAHCSDDVGQTCIASVRRAVAGLEVQVGQAVAATVCTARWARLLVVHSVGRAAGHDHRCGDGASDGAEKQLLAVVASRTGVRSRSAHSRETV